MPDETEATERGSLGPVCGVEGDSLDEPLVVENESHELVLVVREDAHDEYEVLSERLREDRSLSADIERVAASIRDGSVLAAVEDGCGELL